MTIIRRTSNTLALLFCLSMVGCSSVHVLSDSEQQAINAGVITVVLVRIQCNVENLDCRAFGTSAWIGEPYVHLGVGSFETIGEPVGTTHHYLSDESRGEGWTYFLLSPGVFYLAVVGPRTDAIYQNPREAPRWRIDIPENTGLLYAGTLTLSGKTDSTFLLGGKVVKPADNKETIVTDESDLAQNLLAGHFTNHAQTKTSLMQPWRRGDPIIIRSPQTDLKR